MVKQSLSNYFKNLKYCFTSLGTIFLGVLFGVCFLVAGIKNQINVAATDIQTITEQANIDPNDLKNCLKESFAEVSWEDPVQAIKTIASSEWINGTLKVNLEASIKNYENYAEAVEKAIMSAISGYTYYVVMFALCAVLGLIAGFLLTRYLVRQTIAKRGKRKFVLVTLFDSVLMVGLIALCLWLTLLWQPSIIFVSVFAIIIYGLISLLEAYFVQGYKKVPFRKVVNVKNSLLLFVSDIIIYVISFAISGIIISLTNGFVGAFIALPLFIIAINVISLNAEACIKKQVEGTKSKAKAEGAEQLEAPKEVSKEAPKEIQPSAESEIAAEKPAKKSGRAKKTEKA